MLNWWSCWRNSWRTHTLQRKYYLRVYRIQYTWTCSPKYCSPYNYFTELLFHCSGHVVARVQLDQITTEAYQHCFSAIFHEEGLSQLWSWQISSGASSRLVWSADEGAVSVDIAAKVAKECRVHFICSMKRVSKKVQSTIQQHTEHSPK